MERCCYEAGSGEDHLGEPLALLLLSVNSACMIFMVVLDLLSENS